MAIRTVPSVLANSPKESFSLQIFRLRSPQASLVCSSARRERVRRAASGRYSDAYKNKAEHRAGWWIGKHVLPPLTRGASAAQWSQVIARNNRRQSHSLPRVHRVTRCTRGGTIISSLHSQDVGAMGMSPCRSRCEGTCSMAPAAEVVHLDSRCQRAVGPGWLAEPGRAC